MRLLFGITVFGISVSPVIVYWVFSNLVGTMPSIEEVTAVGKGPAFVLLYKWAYNLLHVASGNAPHVFPSLRMSASQDDPKKP